MDEIRDIVKKVVSGFSSRKEDENSIILNSWKDFVGNEGMRHTQVVGFNDGKILIHVDSPAWLYQMNVKKRKFLVEIQEKIPKVKNVIFIIGRVNQ